MCIRDSSVGADVRLPPGQGPQVFRVHGQICHRAGELVPGEGTPPTYAQLYVYDPTEALECR